MIEVEVHQQLRHLLRRSPDALWPHQLTMARLVARGLRLGRSALIQLPDGEQHRISYLLPALMWSGATILCASEAVQAQILGAEIPWLQEALHLRKPVLQSKTWPGQDFAGLLLMDPLSWLQQRLSHLLGDPSSCGGLPFPTNIPLLIDGAEQLEDWLQQSLTLRITSKDWPILQRAVPALADRISQIQVDLTLALMQRPLAALLLHEDEKQGLRDLLQELPQEAAHIPITWRALQKQISCPHRVLWAEAHRETGQFTLHSSPIDLATAAGHLWTAQPVVLMGEALDLDRQALNFRQRLGLPDLTALRFLPDSTAYAGRQDQSLQLYLPLLPPPNSPQFREALLTELKRLICEVAGAVVVLVSDQPLQAQVGAALAAEFGSRVRVNLPYQAGKGILVCGWEYWLDQKAHLPKPDLLAIATLPFPSMEHPLVAGHVQYLQQQRQDWFRTYLLPIAAAYLQRGITPLRHRSGRSAEATPSLVAILDSRIIARSYGAQLLDPLGPIARLSRSQLFA